MKNKINETGMYVTRNNDEEVLTANDKGVTALNLTAKKYLTIESHARFEDYGVDRTACYWI